MFLQKTSLDSIAIWTPLGGIFVKPIVLSTGTGVENFFNIDQPPTNVIMRQTLNRNIFSIVRPVVLTGSATFQPQSDALVALRAILEYQRDNGVAVYGTCIIINAGSLLMDRYDKFIWSNPYSSPNRNKVLSDVSLNFTCNPPSSISLGSIAAIGTTISGILG